MSKPSLEERLLDLLYGDLDPETAAAVEAEVKTDPVLRERLEAWRQVRHAMADLPEPQPDPQVRYAILRAARQAVEKPEKKGIFAWFTALSMSPAFAALGLAVLGGGLWFALSQGYRDSEAPPESRLEKAAVGAPPSVVQDARIAPPPTVTVAASEGLQAVPRADEGTVAVGEAEEKPLAENLLQKVAEEAPQAEPEAAKKGADGAGMAPLAAERAEAEPAEPDPARPAEPAEGGEAKTIAGDKAPEAPRARRAAPRAAEAAAAEGRSAGKALLDLATKDDRVAGDAEDRGFGGGGLTAEDAFAGAPPPADEAQAAGLREKKSKVAPSPFPAEESEAQKPQRAVAGPAERPAAPRDVVADAPVGGAAAPGDDDAEKARDLPKNQAAGVKTVDQVPAEAAPQAPVPETAQAPAPGQAVDDAPRQATVLGAAKVAKEADTDEVAADEAGAEEVAVDRPAAGAAVDGLARAPAREQPPGTPGELLEARNARRRGDHDAAVEAYQRYFAGYRSDDQVASAWLEAAQSYEALGNLASALQLYRLAARSQDPQVARTARERISAIESLRKDAARAPAEAAPAEAADTAPAEPAPAEQKP